MVFLTGFESDEAVAIPAVTATILLFFTSDYVILPILIVTYLSGIIVARQAQNIAEEFDSGESEDDDTGLTDRELGAIILFRPFKSFFDESEVNFVLLLLSLGGISFIVSNFLIFFYSVGYIFLHGLSRTTLSFLLVLSTIFQFYNFLQLIISSLIGAVRPLYDEEYREEVEGIGEFLKE